MVELRPILESHADALFPLIFNTSITETIQWDGPHSIEQYREALREREQQTRSGLLHVFTVFSSEAVPMGTIDIRPDPAIASASVGLWIGAKFHGMGHGTEAVRLITRYGFENLKLQRIHASVFAGNIASRRIFERNGFQLEGIFPLAVLKRGVFLDAWSLRILREVYEASLA